MKSQPDNFEPIGLRSATLALLTAALWGGTPVAIRFSVTSLGPIAVSGVRFAMATLFMVAWAKMEGTPLRLRKGQLLPCLIGGLVLFFQISFFTAGIKFANASHGTVLINTFVFWVILAEVFLLRRPFPANKVAGLLLASLGAGIVLLRGLSPSEGSSDTVLMGDTFLLLSALILAGKILFTKYAVRRVEPTKFIFWHDVFGVILFAAAGWTLEDNSWSDVTLPAILGLAYQGILVAGMCFAIQARLLKRHSAAQLSVYSFATPIFGLVFAALLANEPLTIGLALSCVCVAAGILLVTRPSREASH